MNALRHKLKSLWFRLLGKDPDAVIVHFWTGDPALARRMSDQMRALEPSRRHFIVEAGEPGSCWKLLGQLRRRFRGYRIGLAPVLFTEDRSYRALRQAAFLLAPRKILAYNARLERHHLRLRAWMASWLFLNGVPLDRIFLRPSWLFPFKKDRSVFPSRFQAFDGRPLSDARRRIAVVSPYFPYPLSHGGAVRIYNLLKEAASEFDLFLFAFCEQSRAEDIAPVLEFCAKVVLLPVPRYREPRWSTLLPPDVREFRSELLAKLLEQYRAEYAIKLVQIEYTCLATYAGDILVEHDVTLDLFRQVREEHPSRGAWWDAWRWRRFETRAVRRFRRVVFMSGKDAALLAVHGARVIPNGVDLERFRPQPEPPGQRLLFIGSFRHFPNILAYRFLLERVWPLLRDRFPDMHVTVVAGPDPLLRWRTYTNSAAPPVATRVRLLEFVRDVRPLYAECNIVLVPTLVSAGTNVKVLEAMAMERAVVSTPSGCAGLGLVHGSSVWIAGAAEDFADGIARLAEDPALRRRLALAARRHAEQNFGWRELGARQRALWRELLQAPVALRPAVGSDLEAIGRIQSLSPQASQWEPRRYLDYDCKVAMVGGAMAGFVVVRKTGMSESEILNLAVMPEYRRAGVASTLVRDVLARYSGEIFLEVRESNTAAQQLYEKLGFYRQSLRPGYYDAPPEAAIVMRFQSC